MDARSPGGYRYVPSINVRQAWGKTDDQYSPTSQQRYTEDTNARHGRETGRQSQTTEQEMDVDSSDDTRREKMPSENIAALFLKLEGLPTLIQNSKQEMRAWKQLLSTRSSDETLKLKEEIEMLRMENQTLKTRHHDRISSNRNDEKDLEQELQKAKQTNEEYKNYNSKVVREYEKAVAKIENLEQTVADDQRHIDKITRECVSVKEQMSALQKRYQAAKDEKVKIEKELSESKTRLSRMMGNKLGDNNPDIADLSDKNRPTKIAEKNTELYDNEWTDAYEVFLNHYKTEKQTIEKLLEMLQDIKSECDKITKEQEQKLTEAVKLKRSAGSVPDHVFKQLKDFRRFTAEESLPEVIEICLSRLRYKSYSRFLKSTDVLKFFKGCVELCWFMNVQDPPLAFGDIPMKNDQFDVNYFKFYTSTGSNFEYTVWPVLLLMKDGAILSKGVAQASGEQKAESQRRKTRNAEAARNGMGSVSNERIWDERKDQNLSDKNPTTTYLYDNNRFSQSHEDKNYKQSVAGGPGHFTDKNTLSQTVKAPGSTTDAGRMSRNIGSRSHRESESSESESGSSGKQVRSYRPNYSDPLNMYGINSPEVKLLERRYGIQSTESDV